MSAAQQIKCSGHQIRMVQDLSKSLIHRKYNSRQLAQKLEQEHGVKLSPDRLRRILKKQIGGL